MATIRSTVENAVKKAFQELDLDTSFSNVTISNRPDLCQFQCNGALALAKKAGKNPREIAGEVVSKLDEISLFSLCEVAGPGFINLSVADSFLIDFCKETISSPTLNCEKVSEKQTTLIDFGGPNVAKPMHVGHLRSAIIGDSLQRLFKFLGHNVISDNHLGDWGTQMGMLICELKRREPSLPYFNNSKDFPTTPPCTIKELEEMYPLASAACKADPQRMSEALEATEELQKGKPGYVALWKHFVNLSVETLKTDFNALEVSFDHWLGESFYMDRMISLVDDLKEKKVATPSEGALIIPVAEESDKKEIPPVMLVKSGGGFLYATSDIATISYRVEKWNPDRICYVVDKRQSLHFEQVFRAVKKAEIISDNLLLEHVGFGTVNGSDGKPYKTREGGVMKLSDLIELVIDKAREKMKEAGIAGEESPEEQESIAKMVGMAALKFADLMNHRLSDYVFDIDKFSRFEGKTGPYLLYTAVRIKSILRRAEISEDKKVNFSIIRGETERDLLLEIGRFEDVLTKSAKETSPNILCDYIYDISQRFNRFYRECHIMNEQDPQLKESWLSLAALTLRVMETTLSILGISIPEKM